MSFILTDLHKFGHETWLQFRKFHVNRTGETAKPFHMPYLRKHVISSFLNKITIKTCDKK
jgi:hypothetical protein